MFRPVESIGNGPLKKFFLFGWVFILLDKLLHDVACSRFSIWRRADCAPSNYKGFGGIAKKDTTSSAFNFAGSVV